jgi:heme exporter protein D
MILWGNAWPVIFALLALSGRGRFLWAAAGFGVLAMILGFAHVIKHTHVKDAARRGRAELEGAKLLDGHPAEEVEDAFTAACLEHLALPYSRTWWKLLLFR